jgi:molybdate transport system regulatory protein
VPARADVADVTALAIALEVLLRQHAGRDLIFAVEREARLLEGDRTDAAGGARGDRRGQLIVHRKPTVRIRIVFDQGMALGPGKADLLAGIAEHGSIAAAARSMKMSYQRAWSLVDELNHAFRSPLVESTRGGAHRGGARLTAAGLEVVSAYRAAEDSAAKSCAAPVERLRRLTAEAAP